MGTRTPVLHSVSHQARGRQGLPEPGGSRDVCLGRWGGCWGGHIPEVGRADAALGEGSSCNPGWQGLGHANPGAVGAQDVAVVRPSPEKGHSGARVGVCGTPALADGCLSSPSPPQAPAPGWAEPSREGRGGAVRAPLGQLQLKVKVRRSPDCQPAGGPVGSRPPAYLRPGSYQPPGCPWGEVRKGKSARP